MEKQMSDKDLNKQIDELEAAAKKYASKDTVISIGGYEFTPAKLMVAFTLVSSALGGLYGAFEVYKDYQSMKKKIAEYSAPDLSDFDKRLAVIEENSQKASDYTRDIKVDLKSDIRRNESVTEQVERSVKQAQRETESEMREMRKAVREDLEKARNEANAIRREMADTRKEVERDVVQLKREIDQKIQKAIDNPLANNR
jgi:hypothetical protein